MLGAYNRATLAISITVEDLLQDGGIVSRAMYDIRRHAVERARIGFESAELAYETHIDEHHCEARAAAAAGSVIYTVSGN